MSEATQRTWEEANQICLAAELAAMRARLENFLAVPEGARAALPAVDTAAVRAAMPAPPALEILAAAFGLGDFERRVLLMCAGSELDSRLSHLYAIASKELHLALPTFSLALAAFEDAQWSALLPTQPLRHWRLIEIQSGDTLTTSPLRIDERILHFLAGLSVMDERLRGLTTAIVAAVNTPRHGEGKAGGGPPRPEAGDFDLPASHRALAEQVAASWLRAGRDRHWPAVQVWGGDAATRRGVAAAACALHGLHVRAIASRAVPRPAAELDLFIRLWEREAALAPCALLVEWDGTEPADAESEAALKRLVESLRSALVISARDRMKPVERRVLWFEAPRPSTAEQIQIWNDALGPAAAALDGRVERIVSQFSLSPGDIYAAVAQAAPETGADGRQGGDRQSGHAQEGDLQPGEGAAEAGAKGGATGADRLAAALWEACRIHARPRLEGLAQRIDPLATWRDLVLPAPQKLLLRQIALHVRHRNKVYQTWGFAAKSVRGLGISALFAGPSGTGKTMAGEVLANELQLDLYRIDLSQVVSKYIGETEKNLRRVFDAAEGGGAILLFDEADALFGKRSEVKDSHDRYANIEVGYLLQRMEAYRGLAILTTNRQDALDTAFLRRIRFVVEFPFPDPAQRAEIWRRVFPAETPTEGLRVDRLAHLNAAGGNIHNIAMAAAFLAADADEPVRMAHLLAAARDEFLKLDRPLTDAETAGWA